MAASGTDATISPRDVKDRSPQHLDEIVTKSIVRLCRWSVGATMFLIGALALIDTLLIGSRTIMSGNRLVTPEVLLFLIGASVVQVGAASAAVIYILHKSQTPLARDTGRSSAAVSTVSADTPQNPGSSRS